MSVEHGLEQWQRQQHVRSVLLEKPANTNSHNESSRDSGGMSHAVSKHFQRLERARKQRAEKSAVPHATGKSWTGKLTTPKAPVLSYQTRSKQKTGNKKVGRASGPAKQRVYSASRLTSAKIRSSRGSFSRAPVNRNPGTQNAKATGGASEAPDSPADTGLVGELARLRAELQMEEERRQHLLQYKKQVAIAAPACPSTASSAANTAFAAATVAADSYSPLPPPPPPPPGPPPAAAERILTPAPKRTALTHTRPELTLESIAFDTDAENMQPTPDRVVTWEDMKAFINQQRSSDEGRRRMMEDRLRQLERRNLEILGVDKSMLPPPARQSNSDRRQKNREVMNRSSRSSRKHLQRMSNAARKRVSRGKKAAGGSFGKSRRNL